MFSVGSSEYTVAASVGELPPTYPVMLGAAAFHDDFGIEGADGTLLVLTVARHSGQHAHLIVSQRFSPGPEAGFHPAALLVPETHLLFVGAGVRIACYDLRTPRRLWEDAADVGFWGWKRHQDVVLMSAELELAAWDIDGRKLWSTFVEPPWEYDVHGSSLELDVMGNRSRFDVRKGPTGVRAD